MLNFMQVYLHYNKSYPFRSLNNNHLTGEIPDAFQSLTQLINLYGLIFNNTLNIFYFPYNKHIKHILFME